MPVWHLTIKLGDLWRADIGFPEKRDKIVSVLKISGWRDLTDRQEDFDELIDELSETLNIQEFDLAFSDIYDLADADRVWIETIG